MTDDATLLKHYAETHAETAFAEIVRRYVDRVFSGALRRVGGDVQLAEDVTQQVFVALARKAHVVAQHPVPSAWLHTTTRHEAANVVRAERRRKAREQAALDMDASNPNSPAPDAWRQIEPMLDAALDDLDEADRSAVLLRFIDRRAYAEIGETLRVSEDAARMRVDRALEKLRRILNRRGIASSATALGSTLTSHAVGIAPAGLGAKVIGGAVEAGLFTSAAGVAGLMSMTKLAVSAAGIAVLATAIGIATQAGDRRQRAETAIAESERQIAALTMKTTAARQRRQRAEHEAAEAARIADAPKSDAALTAARPAAPVPVEPRDPLSRGDAFLARHPSVKSAVADYARARADFRYSELYRRLNLEPHQIERFREIVSRGIGMGASDHAGASMSLSSGIFDGNARTRELTEVLGPDGYRAFQDYGLWIEPARDIAARVAMATWATDTPLSPERADALVSLISETRAIPGAGRSRGSSFSRFDWDAVLAKAPALLAPAQIAALEAVRAREDLHAAYNRPVTPAPTSSGKAKEGTP